MYKNPSEIVAHEKRLRSKVVVPKKFSLKVTAFSYRNSFFPSTVFLYFTKVATAIHSSVDRAFLKRTLTAMNCVYTMYLKGIELICNFSSSHPFDE